MRLQRHGWLSKRIRNLSMPVVNFQPVKTDFGRILRGKRWRKLILKSYDEPGGSREPWRCGLERRGRWLGVGEQTPFSSEESTRTRVGVVLIFILIYIHIYFSKTTTLSIILLKWSGNVSPSLRNYITYYSYYQSLLWYSLQRTPFKITKLLLYL